MSLKVNLGQFERHLDGKRHHSRKRYKIFRNKWLRRFKLTEVPLTKLRKGWEY